MSTTKTRRELVLRTLDVLGVSAVGQVPAAEDYAAVDAQVDATLGTLAASEVVYVPDADAIPAEWFNPLADVLAFALCTDFGVGSEEKAELSAKAAAAERALKLMTRGRPTYERMTPEYF